MLNKKREHSGFLIKQRSFLKLYLITNIESGRWYGMKLLNKLKEDFEPFGFSPRHPEVYRALGELLDDGILKSGILKKEDSHYQEITVYYIRDVEKARSYKKLMKKELKRSEQLIKKALFDNY